MIQHRSFLFLTIRAARAMRGGIAEGWGLNGAVPRAPSKHWANRRVP
jgi:hypothetical protein